ncbi:hypothetical protein FACS1894172_07500 [Spirochaetia bacterium]|nr:hypothetical protein FACS1894164_02230 [Spirochaetia bacterium]GHU31870.1 hypothetical protein FACS1894172_07500 [Spirochaetia bacterium]
MHKRILFQRDNVLIPESDAAAFPFDKAICTDILDIHYAELPAELAIPAQWRALPVRETNDPAILRAFHLVHWRAESVFCGSCGCRNNDSMEEIARICPQCGRIEYPRISPAILACIINDKDQILLAHNTKFPAGRYSLVAGFIEPGETVEETVSREVREEVAVTIDTIRYVGSQPWPFPSGLMIGFRARYVSGEIKVDGIEIEDAQWFSRNSLPDLPPNGSLSRTLIDAWCAEV